MRSQYGECDGPRPVSYKVLRQPLSDPIFRSICANTESLTLFAHIRAASGETAIVPENCHPFTLGRWSFMHNGVVAHFSSIKRLVVNALSQDALDFVKGTTDSEHLAALFFTYLQGHHTGTDVWDHSHSLAKVKRALERAISDVLEMQRETIPYDKLEASSLNLAVTDGIQLLAVRFRNHPTQHPPSLYFSTKAGVTLNRKYPSMPSDLAHALGLSHGRGGIEDEHGEHVIIASEPTTFNAQDWHLIGKNECIMVGRDMVVHREQVDVEF